MDFVSCNFLLRILLGKSQMKRLDWYDRLMIQRCLENGTPIKQIAAYAGKAINTISEEISKNGGKAVYSAQEAQNRADMSKDNTIQSRKKPLQELTARVDELERQVKMLLDKL